MKTLSPKDAVAYSNKLVIKKCGDGLMKDVMRVCIHWFLKVAYNEGYALTMMDATVPEDQLTLFDEKGPEDGQK